ncbi:hypothetical protein HanXRQr2_Chr10g0452751 [Helianthus annuus]|uniref:Uncharacterized protein n=1 Tax=Helianthus annuus TaxID=4232 RepID=A0A9K3HZF3_HELAN|nr:hypothetical protein HanXRQr2_Chr10g0452751 [Helianthus annuus]KAJ0884706.1 hypothetical protein HanPSC8_Chr10g0436901 [Helianthus annuus]
MNSSTTNALPLPHPYCSSVNPVGSMDDCIRAIMSFSDCRWWLSSATCTRRTWFSASTLI